MSGYGKPPVHSRFQAGRSGNPGGKAQGTRDRIGKAFLEALADDFDAHGVVAIQQARQEDPMGYVKAVAGLLPKEHQVGITQSLADALRRLAGQPDPALPGESADIRDGGVAGHA